MPERYPKGVLGGGSGGEGWGFWDVSGVPRSLGGGLKGSDGCEGIP